ncbi:MAG: DNA-directed RNA polymerase subunit alpha [Microgenomates group bacterium]
MLEVNFQIKKIKQAKNFAQFSLEPLPQGYGHTLGNALRRVLLTSLPGTAITQVKISGVRHRFSTVAGMKEDVMELLLNLKQIRIKYEGEKPVKLELEKTGPGQVKAGDVQTPAGVEIVNKDLILANLADKKSKLKMELIAQRGFGYLPLEERKSEKIGVILLDAIFSPVIRVNYKVEATRVGRQTDLDRLILEITTDGTMDPQQALKEAAKILISFLSRVVKPVKMVVEEKRKPISSPQDFRLTVEELELPTRIANALRRGGYETVGDLTRANKADLASVKNLGEKSLKIIRSVLEKRGIVPSWGEK